MLPLQQMLLQLHAWQQQSRSSSSSKALHSLKLVQLALLAALLTA
jgi:hypothetical protein